MASRKKIRVQDGHLFVCNGCCCGRTEKGFPALPLEEFKQQWKKRGFRRRFHLTISGCLGPCPLANVVLLQFRGRSMWFHSINHATGCGLDLQLRGADAARGDESRCTCRIGRSTFSPVSGRTHLPERLHAKRSGCTQLAGAKLAISVSEAEAGRNVLWYKERKIAMAAAMNNASNASVAIRASVSTSCPDRR